MFRLLVFEDTDGEYLVIIFGDRSRMAVSWAVASAGRLVGEVGGFDFPHTREEQDVGTHC